MNEQQTAEPALSEFATAYVLAALWTFDEDAPSGDYETSGRFEILFPLIDRTTLLKMIEDCAKFQTENAELIEQAELSESRAGHCFWLSRNGHGSGFFDEYSREDEKEAACAKLQDICQKWGEFDLYYGDDGKIYS